MKSMSITSSLLVLAPPAPQHPVEMEVQKGLKAICQWPNDWNVPYHCTGRHWLHWKPAHQQIMRWHFKRSSFDCEANFLRQCSIWCWSKTHKVSHHRRLLHRHWHKTHAIICKNTAMLRISCGKRSKWVSLLSFIWRRSISSFLKSNWLFPLFRSWKHAKIHIWNCTSTPLTLIQVHWST